MQDFYSNPDAMDFMRTTPNPRNYGNNIDVSRSFPFDEWKDFDYLINQYPSFADRIQQARNQGIPDNEIENFMIQNVESKLDFLANREQSNKFLGRTPETMKKSRDYENARRFDAYKKAYPDKSDDDIFNAIGVSQWSGISTSTLLGNPELFKKLTDGQKLRETWLESIQRGTNNHIVQSQISEIGLKYLRGVISREDAYKKEQELSKGYIEEPIVSTGMNNFLEGGSKIFTQGIYTLGVGSATGAAVGGVFALAAAPLGIPAQGFGVGYKAGSIYASAMRLFALQAGSDMLEFSKLTDENGQPINENAARVASLITGAITVVTELVTLPEVMKLIPGSEKFMPLVGLDRKNVIELVRTSPTVRKALSSIAIDTTKGIGWGTINNVVETLGHDVGIPLAQAFSKQPFPKFEWGIIPTHVNETIVSSVRDFTAAAIPNLLWRISQVRKTVENQKQAYDNYKQTVEELSQVSGIPVPEIERQIDEAINAFEQQTENPPAETPETPAQEKTPEPSQPTPETLPEEIQPPAQEQENPVVAEPDIMTETQGQEVIPEINEVPTETTEVESQPLKQEKSAFVFIPREQFESFKAEHSEFADIEGFNVDNETGLTREEFERLRTEAPDFTASIVNDTREGADGTTINDQVRRIQNTEQEKADIFHSEENQQLIRDTTEDYINAGETQEDASLLAKIRGVINTVMKAREGVSLTPIEITTEQDAETENIDSSRINPDYNISNPETWPNQERAARFMELTNWKNLTESERNIKELLNILRATDQNKADALAEKSDEVIAGIREGEPENIRSEYNSLLRAEYNESKRAYQEYANSAKEAISIKTDLDPTKYEINSEFPAGKKRHPDMSYSFEEFGVNTKIDIATDLTDLKVRIRNSGDTSPLVISIKNYRAANLTQVLDDLLSGTTLNGTPVQDTPLARYMAQALSTAWERLGLSQEDSNGYFYTDPSGGHVSQVAFKYGKALVELLGSYSGKRFAAHVHDIGHVVFNMMSNLAKSGSIQMAEDFQTILRHAGVTLEEWNAERENKRGGAREKAHEYFANAFMVYLSEGNSPTKALKGVFNRVRSFLLELYDDITNQLGVKIDDEVRAVFDRLLTMPGDKDTSVADYVLDDIKISNQIDAYEQMRRSEEEAHNEQIQAQQSFIDNNETLEPSEEAMKAVTDFINEQDYRELQIDEQNTQLDEVKSIYEIVKAMGKIPLKATEYLMGKELAADLRKKWRGWFVQEKSGERGDVSLISNALRDAGFNQFETQNDLIEWLRNTDIESLKEKIQAVQPHIEINNDTINAFLATNGIDETVKYLKERLKFLDEQAQKTGETEEINAERTEIQGYLKSLTPGLDEDVKPVKKSEITRTDVRHAINTAKKVVEGTQQVLSEMKSEIKLASWKEKAEARFEALKQKREADKENYSARLESIQNRMNEAKETALSRLEARHKNAIKKLTERITNLKNFRQSRTEKNQIARMIKSVLKMAKSPSILYDRLQDIKAFLDGYDFDKSKQGKDRRDIIRNFLNNEGEQYTADTLEEANITPEEIEAFTDKIHLEDMSLANVQELYNSVKDLYEQGRREFAIWKKERDQRRADFASSLASEITSRTKEPASRTITDEKDITKQFTLGRVGETAAYYWDAVQTPGRFLAGLGENFRRLFDDEFSTRRGQAADFIHQRETAVLSALKQLGLSVYNFFDNAMELDGQSYTWDNILAIYAGMKNEKSAKAIIWGNFVKNIVDGKKIYSTLEEGMTAINKILDFVNNNPNYKAAADLILKDFDENFERINRARIEAFNKGMEKEGNYTPMFRLRHESSAGLIDTETEQLAQAGNAQAVMQKVEDGFTISRENISEQFQQPINLHLWSNWIRAMQDQEYMSALGGYASDLASAILLRGKEGSVQELIKSRLGRPAWNTLRSIFNDSITDKNALEQDALGRVASYFIKARSFAYVAFSPATMLAQTSSFFTALPYSNRGHLFRSLAEFLEMGAMGRGREFLERVYQKSPELRFTGGDPIDRATSEGLKYNQALRRLGQIASWGYKGVQTFDNWTKSIVFDAVYQSRLAEGYSEADAIRLANRAVHDTQPASTNRETTRMNRAGGMSKLFFTQFMNALAPVFNMAVVDVARNLAHPSWNNVKATAWNILGVGLTIGAAALIKDAFSGKLPTNRELPSGAVDDWAKWLTESEIDNLINTVPVFNSFVSIVRKISGRRAYRAEDRILEPFEALYKAANYKFNPDYEGEYDGKALEQFLKGISLIGVPVPFAGVRQLMRFFGIGQTNND